VVYNIGVKRPAQRGVILIIKIQSEISLASTCFARYRGITSNGCWIFLTRQGTQEVVKLDSYFRVAECFPTCRCYASLCYDPCMQCFWASDERCPSVLYKLDECFREIDLIRLRDKKNDAGVGIITSISYDCEEKCLLLATAIGLVWISIRDEEGLVTCVQKTHQWVTGAAAAGDCYFYCYLAEGKQKIRYCSKSEKVQWECCMPKDLYVDAAVFAYNPKKDEECCLYVLASKHYCYPYILECVPVSGAFCSGLCCKCQPKPPCPEPKPCEDLLESVALVQMALSNILNAEAEKLQKVIATSDNPDILLEANQAVNRTVVNATFLEQILYQKLDLIQEICEPCKSDDPCSPLEPDQKMSVANESGACG